MWLVQAIDDANSVEIKMSGGRLCQTCPLGESLCSSWWKVVIPSWEMARRRGKWQIKINHWLWVVLRASTVLSAVPCIFFMHLKVVGTFISLGGETEDGDHITHIRIR